MAYCPICGAEVAVGLRTCGKCESPVLGNRTDEAQGQTTTESRLAITLTPVAPAKRLFAGAVDAAVVQGFVYLLYFVVLRQLGLVRSRRMLPVLVLVWLAAPVYAVLRDAFGGKSFGKLLFGVTVVNGARRRRGGLADSLLRNVAFSVVLIPVVGPILYALLSVLVGAQIAAGRAQRFGDGMASTLVVDDARSNLT